MSDGPVAVARAYQRQQITLANRVAGQVGKLWDILGGLSDEDMAAFSARAAELVGAAQVQTGALTATYLDTYVRSAGGPPTPDLTGIDPVAAPLRGVALAAVYERPVVAARIARSQGASLIDALRVGRDRALQTADTDVMMAARANARSIMEQIPRIRGYRRVPDPSACMFCLLASTQRYHIGDLMPIHPKCHCTVAPIYGTKDPGRVLERGLAQRLKADGVDSEARVTGRPVVAVHPELGPVLTRALAA